MRKIKIINYEFLKCLLYTNFEEEIYVYKYLENIIYNKLPETTIRNYKKELKETSPEIFTNKIRELIEKD